MEPIRVKRQGDPMMEIRIQRDAQGNLKIDAWIKDVSPSGIVLGNQRPMAPIEICHACAAVQMNILAMALPAMQQKQPEGGRDDQGQQTPTKAN